jgi:hypothetical protein
MDGSAVWKRVLCVLEEIRRREPRGGERAVKGR